METPEVERDMPECDPKNMDIGELEYWYSFSKSETFGRELRRRYALVERDDEYLWDALHPI